MIFLQKKRTLIPIKGVDVKSTTFPYTLSRQAMKGTVDYEVK